MISSTKVASDRLKTCGLLSHIGNIVVPSQTVLLIWHSPFVVGVHGLFLCLSPFVEGNHIFLFLWVTLASGRKVKDHRIQVPMLPLDSSHEQL